jgi:hypothetical protein
LIVAVMAGRVKDFVRLCWVDGFIVSPTNQCREAEECWVAKKLALSLAEGTASKLESVRTIKPCTPYPAGWGQN